MVKHRPSNLPHKSRREITEMINELREKGWIKIEDHRKDRDGGLGNTLEDLLDIQENNEPIADLGEFELKTHRKKSGSLISIFRMEPGPNDRDSILPYLIENYGWPISKPQYPKDEKSLRVDMDAKSYAERGFIINVNSQLKRFEIHFDHTKVPSTIRGETTVEWLKNIERSVGLEDLDENSYYPFEKIQKKISEKSENMLFIKLDTKKEDNDQFMKVDSAYFLEHASIDTFVKAIQMGHLQIEFNARTHHNHGTAFRTWERFLSSIWPDVEKI